MKDQISIKVNIADRIYPLKVYAEEEENIRKAAELINKKVNLYIEQYSIKDKQAALSMCALEIMSESLNSDSRNAVEYDTLKKQLIDIESLLSLS
ncbi:MAG: cell division protein ZapA [Bacteroidetes bacterium]|nr:cell division protein ZapA [Bacteroidota bacterium]MBL6962301.1 cell division protein ZapA [Bacteroidota bacterium]